MASEAALVIGPQPYEADIYWISVGGKRRGLRIERYAPMDRASRAQLGRGTHEAGDGTIVRSMLIDVNGNEVARPTPAETWDAPPLRLYAGA